MKRENLIVDNGIRVAGHGPDSDKTLGCARKDRFHPSIQGPVHQERRNHRPRTGFKASFAERANFRVAHADILHESGRPGPERQAPGNPGKGKRPLVEEDQPTKEEKDKEIHTLSCFFGIQGLLHEVYKERDIVDEISLTARQTTRREPCSF